MSERAVFEPLSDVSDELHFVVHSWVQTYRKSFHGQAMAARGNFDAWMRQRIHRLLQRSVVLVAHAPEHPEQYLGWACGEASTSGLLLHYVYVKSWERDAKLWLELIEDLEHKLDVFGCKRRYTHRTYCTRGWERFGWEFSPQLASGHGESECKQDDTVH